MSLRVHLAPHRARLGIVLACLGLLTGCQSFTTASTTPRLRVIDLSADAGALDIYQGGHAIAYNLGYGTVTSYIALTPGSSITTVVPAGSRQILSSAKAAFVAGGQYTLLIHSSLASLQQSFLADQPTAIGASVRVIHQAERNGAVDLYLVPDGRRIASTMAVALHLAPGVVTAYLPVPEGIGTAIVLPAGTRPSAASLALHTGRQIDYTHGSARTLILLDAPPTVARSLNVIETVDGETPNPIDPKM